MTFNLVFEKGIQFCVNHRNDILTGLTLIGVGVTGFLAARGGKKEAEAECVESLATVLTSEEMEDLGIDTSMSEPVSVKEKIKIYTPAVLAGALTCGCALINHRSFSGQISGLCLSSAVAAKLSNELTKQREGVEVETLNKDEDKKDDMTTPRNYVEAITGKEFQGTDMDLLFAENSMNYHMNENGELTLRQYLNYLGAESEDPKISWFKGNPIDLIGWSQLKFYSDGFAPWMDVNRSRDPDELGRYKVWTSLAPEPIEFQYHNY